MSSHIVKEEDKLFYYMHFARKKSKGIEKYAIYLIGEIRSGKSTSFNWILDPTSIIGKESTVTTQYVKRQGFDSEDVFQIIKDSFISVSLIPNMKKLTKKQINFSLIDLPGFHDSRTSSERMLVNFINNTCFSHTSFAKFILVISKADFIHPTGLGLANTIKEFVKLFKQFPPSERAKVFQSVGILITSVELKDYQRQKQKYLDGLYEKLKKMKEMQESVHYYTLMQELIQSIMKDQRLELFQMAKDSLSPSASTLIEDFNGCGWTFYDLQNHKENISYPYQQYYQSLTSKEQDKINIQISNKIRQFQEIQKCMASMIDNYLKRIMEQKGQNQDDERFIQLEKILDRNRVEHLQRQMIGYEEMKKPVPLRTYKNIIALLQITYEIQDDKQRAIEDQKVHYLTYLGYYFKKSIKIFSQSFALTRKHHETFAQIGQVFLEIMEELKCIVQIDRTLESQYRRLKQSIQIMNGIQLLKEDIQQSFITFFKEEHFEDLQGSLYEEQTLNQIIEFLNSLNWIHFNIQEQFYISRKVYHAMGTQIIGKNKQKSVSFYLNSLEYNLKLFLIIFREDDSSRMQQQYQQKIQDIEDYFKKIMEDIFVLMYFVDKTAIFEILKEMKFLFLMKQSYSKLQKYFEGKTVYLLLREYGICYLERGYYSHAIDIFKKLQKNSKNDRAEAQKMLQIAKKRKTENRQSVFVQYSYCDHIEQLIELANKISERVQSNPVRYNKMKMLEEFSELSKKKHQKLNQNEFEYTLPQELDQSDTIIISRQLIQKISKKKVILMFGKHAGKSTAFYWLQNKQLVCKQISNKKQLIFDLSSKKSNENRINHRGFDPTFIPNIGSVSQDEVLIDFPNIFESKIINVMIKLEMLSTIIRNSKDIKFLLVVKQDDLIKNNCVDLFSMFTFLLKILPEKKELYRHFSLLITYSNYPDEKPVKQFLRDFSLEFGKDEANVTDFAEKFEEKYRIKLQNKQIYKDIIDYFALQSSIIIFQKANRCQQSLPINFQNISKKDDNWRYLESSQIQAAAILSQIVTVSKQQQQAKKIKQMVKKHLNSAKYLIGFIKTILSKIITKEKIDQSYLLGQVGKEFIEKWKTTESWDTKLPLQLLNLNKILSLKSFIKFCRLPNNYINCSVAQVNSTSQQFFDLIKKLALGQNNQLILASWAKEKLKKIMVVVEFIQNFKNSSSNNQIQSILGQELSCFHYLLGDNIDWTDDDYQRFNDTIITLFQRINVDKLIEQMLEKKANVCEQLLKLICSFQKVQNWSYFGLQNKWYELVNKFRQLSQKSHKPIDQLHSQIILFQYQKKKFQAKNDQLDYKFIIINIISETVIICASTYRQFGLKICKMLNCHKTLQNFIDELAKHNNGVQSLKQLMDLCLSVGYTQKYYQLLNIYVKRSEDEAEKSRYIKIRNQTVEKQYSKKQIAYDNIHHYTAQDLENICEEIKQFWLEQSKK